MSRKKQPPTFAESLAALGLDARRLIALGLPRSTAYEWINGSSTPDHAAFILALLRVAPFTD